MNVQVSERGLWWMHSVCSQVAFLLYMDTHAYKHMHMECMHTYTHVFDGTVMYVSYQKSRFISATFSMLAEAKNVVQKHQFERNSLWDQTRHAAVHGFIWNILHFFELKRNILLVWHTLSDDAGQSLGCTRKVTVCDTWLSDRQRQTAVTQSLGFFK